MCELIPTLGKLEAKWGMTGKQIGPEDILVLLIPLSSQSDINNDGVHTAVCSGERGTRMFSLARLASVRNGKPQHGSKGCYLGTCLLGVLSVLSRDHSGDVARSRALFFVLSYVWTEVAQIFLSNSKRL